MKNKFKKALPLLLLLMVPLSIYAAMNWEGSENVTTIKSNLTLIQNKIDNLKDAATNEEGQTIEQIEELLKGEIEDLLAKIEKLEKTQNNSGKQEKIDKLEKQVEDLQEIIDNHDDGSGTIDELNAEITRLEAENLTLTSKNEALQDDNTRLAGENTDLSAELDQALKDVQEIEAITYRMVNQ